MSDVEYHPTSPSAFPRPTSLFQPERYTPSVLDSSSYSPFPTVGGSRADPFGLNAYLLHPEDQIWAYISPSPCDTVPASPNSPKSRKGGLKKMTSAATLRKGSPLSQTSVVSALPLPAQDRRLMRKRSQSMDSVSSATAVVERDQVVAQKAVSGKKGFGRLFGRRKSISSIPAVIAEDLPPVPSLPAAFTPSSSPSDLSTPTSSNRSSLIVSEHGSTASSSSSVYILQTPQASPSQSTDSLAEAIAKAEGGDDGGMRKRGLMGWLRRPVKISVAAPSSAESSPSVSPNTSTTNLTSSPAPSIITDPPSRISPTPEQIPYAWIGDQLRRASYRKLAQLRRPSPHPLAQQLRRQTSHLPNEVASSFEVGKILYPRSINPRDPSAGLVPAQHGLWCLLGVKLVLDQLDRGALPSGAMGKRPSLPHSSSTRKTGGMRDFIVRPPFEDRYLVFYPDDIWSPVSMARPGFGVWDLDFSKYILALADSGDADNRASWPSLPRPSFLGFDGLRSAEDAAADSEAEQVVLEISEEAAFFIAAPSTPVMAPNLSQKAASIGSSYSDDSATTDGASTAINTPLGLDGYVVPEIKIDFEDAELRPMALEEPALELREAGGMAESSFRRQKVQQTWEESDDEDDGEEEEEEVRPLRESVRTSASQPQGMKVSASAPDIRDAVKTHSRRISQPIPTTIPSFPTGNTSKRRSQFDMAGMVGEEERQQKAMAEVARARERRQVMQSGELDRRAEGETRRKEEAKRRSVMPSASASAPSRPQSQEGRVRSSLHLGAEEQRQRTKSFVQTTSGTLVDQPRSIGQAKRYHSFYELPSSSSSSTSNAQAYTRGASHPSPQQFSHSNPHHPGMVHSASMGFVPTHPHPAVGYYPQQPMHAAQGMYFPAPPGQYGYPSPMMYGMGSPAGSPIPRPAFLMPTSQSTLSLPDQQRRQRQRLSYT